MFGGGTAQVRGWEGGMNGQSTMDGINVTHDGGAI